MKQTQRKHGVSISFWNNSVNYWPLDFFDDIINLILLNKPIFKFILCLPGFYLIKYRIYNGCDQINLFVLSCRVILSTI